jgi:hypothetical protein
MRSVSIYSRNRSPALLDLRVANHPAHVREQRSGFINESVMNRPSHATDPLNLSRLIVQTLMLGEFPVDML